jgi:hypothetical protein
MYSQDILLRFIDDDGLVTAWPSKFEFQTIVLEYLATKFQRDTPYNEKEVNEILKMWHTFSDWPLLRRELVDRGFMTRDLDGSNYMLVVE